MNRDAFSVGQFREQVLAEGLAGPGDFLGCSDEEITAVVRAQGVVALPALYRDFLAVMGTYVEGEEPAESFATFREFLVSLADMRRREVATYRELEASGRFSMSRVEDDG